MRLTDAQVAWNKKATEYEALRAEINRTIKRTSILEKTSPTAASIMRQTYTKLMDHAHNTYEELKKMKGPDDETEEKDSIQGASTAR